MVPRDAITEEPHVGVVDVELDDGCVDVAVPVTQEDVVHHAAGCRTSPPSPPAGAHHRQQSADQEDRADEHDCELKPDRPVGSTALSRSRLNEQEPGGDHCETLTPAQDDAATVALTVRVRMEDFHPGVASSFAGQMASWWIHSWALDSSRHIYYFQIRRLTARFDGCSQNIGCSINRGTGLVRVTLLFYGRLL